MAIAINIASAKEDADDLTIIWSGLGHCIRELAAGDELIPLLREMQTATKRCGVRAQELIDDAKRQGARGHQLALLRLLDSTKA